MMSAKENFQWQHQRARDAQLVLLPKLHTCLIINASAQSLLLTVGLHQPNHTSPRPHDDDGFDWKFLVKGATHSHIELQCTFKTAPWRLNIVDDWIRTLDLCGVRISQAS